jgi:hypothetical protein
MGEWGGGLYYKPNDTLKNAFYVNEKSTSFDNQIAGFSLFMLANDPTRKVINGKWIQIAPGNTVIQGLAHMGQNYGSVSKVTQKKDSFTVSKFFTLKDAPSAIAAHKNKIFVASYNKFYSIKDGKEELVLDNLFWEGLAPNSIAFINEKNIFVGMHGGFAKIDLHKKGIKFYVYKQ